MIDRTGSVDEALTTHVRAGQVLMVGGFGRGGTPFTLLEHLATRAEICSNLTLVKNDANEPNIGVDLLLQRGMVSRLIATHVGLNPSLVARLERGELEAQLIPQGIFAERIRAAGAGIVAFLSDIGIDTPVAEERETVELDGRSYLVERALPGDVALVCADRVDRSGNCWWRGTNRNMGPVMATACRIVIVEAIEIVPVGALAPEEVHLPHVFVDVVVPAEPR